jgi:ABC-type transport system involved in multi-copper enzyme maturation permease subunit
MNPFKAIFQNYALQLKRGKAWKWFALIGLIPSAIILTTLTMSAAQGWGSGSKSFMFMEITLNYFFKFFILLVPLFYSTSVLAEEIEQQTVVFLFTLPLDRGKILLAKFTSALIHALGLVAVCLLPALLLTNQHQLTSLPTLKSITVIWLTALLGTLCYSAFSFFLGVTLRRPMMVGLFFVFGWEQFVQFMPGFAQKLSIIYFVKSTLPVALPEKASLLRLFQQTTPAPVAVIVLLALTIGFCTAAMYHATRREYVMGDQ